MVKQLLKIRKKLLDTTNLLPLKEMLMHKSTLDFAIRMVKELLKIHKKLLDTTN